MIVVSLCCERLTFRLAFGSQQKYFLCALPRRVGARVLAGISSAAQHLHFATGAKEKEEKSSASRAGVLSTGDKNKDEVTDMGRGR